MSLEIIPAGPDVQDEILAAAKETFRIHRAATTGGKERFEDSDLQVFLMDALTGSARHRVFAARSDAAFAGYMLLTAPEDGSTIAFVNDIWVDPQHRGKGIAPALLTEAIAAQDADGWPYLAATIADWNLASRGAFRKSGFLEWREHGFTDVDKPIHIMIHPGKGLGMPNAGQRKPWIYWACGAALLVTALAFVSL
ncbi:GNAT family N-acetyltransferase [Pacificoceanicola onchidii]|uniref:GNAT family N-acetyltransferase n=1 Tax=Pacificoceanicola onchidii TaxID=2562685 RepID=UPI0010A470FE|nr:GNAT family N-acetyltransferase [Pacificoceanicola onchidii]